MKRFITAGLALVMAATGVAGGPIHSRASSPCTVWTDPANDEKGTIPTDAGPQNDLVSATLSTTGNVLVVRTHVQKMSLTPPLGDTGMEWWFTFRDGTQPAGYVLATIDMNGQTSYSDAILDNGAAGQVYTDTGTIVTGPDGYVEVDVPFWHFNMQAGDMLHGIGGQASVDPLGDTVDTAGLGTYVVGSSC